MPGHIDEIPDAATGDCNVLFLLCNKLYVQYCVVFFIAHLKK